MQQIILYISKNGAYYWICFLISWYFAQRKCLVKFTQSIDFDNMDNMDNKIIIPCGVKEHCILFKSKIYKKLDNKSKCYKLMNNCKDLLNSDIKLINSYSYEYIRNNQPNIKKNVIIKPNDGRGSMGIEYKEDYIYNLIEEYTNCQIQDVINNKDGYEFICCCKNGKIISNICMKTNIINRNVLSYVKGIDGYIVENEKIYNFVKIFVESIGYNGFAEFEFIGDEIDIYFMECNARISGWVNDEHIFDKIIIPFINEFYKTNILAKTNKNKMLLSATESRIHFITTLINKYDKMDNIINKYDFFTNCYMNFYKYLTKF
jgi:hypothetical protein